MKNLLRRLSKADDPARRQELEQQAAEEIKAAGSTPPPEAGATSWPTAQPTGPAPAPEAEAGQPQPAPVPGRRLTAQQRAAARQVHTAS